MRTPLVQVCQKPHGRRTARSFVHLRKYTQDISHRVQNGSLAFKPVANIWKRTATNSINADNTVITMNTHSQDEGASDEFRSYGVVRQVTIREHTQATVLIGCQGAELVVIEIEGNIFECHCSMTERGSLDIIPAKPSHVCIVMMIAKSVG